MDWIGIKIRPVLLLPAARNAVEHAKRKLLPGRAFFIFNLALVLGLGGVLCLLRFETDIHSAVEASFSHIFFVALCWLFALVFYVGLLISSAARTETQNINTIFLIVAFFEIFGFGWLTHHTFTAVPRSMIIEEHAKVLNIIKNDRHDMPKKINEFVTLVDEVNKGHFIFLFYNLKETPGFVWDEKQMRDELKAQTCIYFSDPDRYGMIDNFVHIFSSEGVRKYSFLISRKDCS